MELLVRVHRPGASPADLRVEVDHDQPTARLAAALAHHLGESAAGVPRLQLLRTGSILDPETAIGDSGLLSGDEVVLGPDGHAHPPRPIPVRAVSLDVLAGPDSGQNVVLDRGNYSLGREHGAAIIFSDPTVSRLHLHLEVAADWTVTVTPVPDTENGVLVNDRQVFEPTVVGDDDIVTIGSTRVAFREFIRAPEEAIDRLGQIEFHRTAYRPQPIQERKLEPLGPIPIKPEPRRFQVLMLLGPIVMGIVLFLILQNIRYMAFILLSPMMMIANWVEDRRTGRHRYAKAVERFDRQLVDQRDQVREALAHERVERTRAAPDLAELARRAELRTVGLWCRGRTAPDFLSLRLGLGTTRSLVSAPLQAGGDDDLRARALEAVAGHDTITGVPVTSSLMDLGVLAVHGDLEEVDEVAASLVVQAACLHSPEDLIIASAISPERPVVEWLKWLPQTRSVTSPIAGQHLVVDQAAARRLLAALIEVAELRVAESGNRQDRRWPWLLVILDADLDPDPTLVSQLLDRAPEAGISVVWLSTSAARVPRQAKAILDCQPSRGSAEATLWHTDPGVPERDVELGRVNPHVAERVARCLAPIRDASVATATTAIPRAVPLLTALGAEQPDGTWIASRWATQRPYGLEHPVGLGADGVFNLDLVADGPHALIGGTSGAGKSELLQSMVASLVSLYPPTRLNFLFVDYKGGASSTVFRPVPHTVGYVTNLDASLAMRALTSLRAELNRRMQLLEGKAKDLEEMLARHPDLAPPSLVIVVDEFATLVKEIPDFVDGMVDIAQRGRSLGIHLVLATQRPSGAVNDNILANTNLRISLRMLDSGESSAIIGTSEAAEIPVPLRGRAFARLGPRELVPFQSAYANAPLPVDSGPEPITITPFVLDGTVGSTGTSATASDAGRTQLDALIDAVVDATALGRYPTPRAPWREMLPSHLTLHDLRDQAGAASSRQPGRHVLLGLLDEPERQDQRPLVVDLEEGGGLLVFGSGGSGKSTLLRTIATSAALDAGPDEVVVFGLDFASRSLRSIEVLPPVSVVGAGDDLEAATRVLALLDGELEHRRRVLADARAETLTAYQAQGGRMARLLLLVDGYPNLSAAFTGGGIGANLEQWVDLLHRLVLDGRQVGIHTVLTSDRRGGIPALLQSAISNRVVLRQAEATGYSDHGIGSAQAAGLSLEAGRGLWNAGNLLQIACVSKQGDGRAQADELSRLVTDGAIRPDPPAITSAALPEVVSLDEQIGGPGELRASLGVADLTLAPVDVDLSYSNLLIAGLPRSGRTTTAIQVAASLQQAGFEVWAIGPSASAATGLAGFSKSAFGRAESIAPVLEELATVADAAAPDDRPRVLVVDDLDSFDDASLNQLWDRLSKLETIRVVATIESRNVSGFTTNALLNEVRKARRALHLRPDDPIEFLQATGIRAPIRPGTPMPAGRAVLVVDRSPTMIQVALPTDASPDDLPGPDA